MITRNLIIIIIILIVCIYINYYTKYKTDYNIIQSTIDTIDINLLYEKYPILIYSNILDPKELLSTLFAYSFIFKQETLITPVVPTINKSKYLLIWNEDHDTMINIINPKYKKNIQWTKNNKYIISTQPLDQLTDVQYISLKLKQNNVLILPHYWIFESTDRLHLLHLDGIFSKIF